MHPIQLAILILTLSLAARGGDNATSWSPVCSDAAMSTSSAASSIAACPALASTLVVPNVTINFGAGSSSGHTFVINTCQFTSTTPVAKTRLVTSGPRMNCSSGFVTQFGNVGSWANCEAVYRSTLAACGWSTLVGTQGTPFVSCMFGDVVAPSAAADSDGALLYSKLEVVLMCSTEEVVGGTATAFMDEVNSAAPPRVVLVVNTPAACSCGAPLPTSTPSSGAVIADALIGSVVAIVVVALTYNIGHNYFVKGLRGWRVLPWAAHFQRRAHTYDHLEGTDDDATTDAPRDTSLQFPVE